MNAIIRRTFVALMAIAFVLAAVSAGAGQATHVWRCEMDDDINEEDVIDLAEEWLTEARKMNGGDKLEAYVYMPVAVNATGEIDFLFVVVAPSFEEWGKFWDVYPESPASQVDDASGDKTACPDSVVWESIKIEPN